MREHSCSTLEVTRHRDAKAFLAAARPAYDGDPSTEGLFVHWAEFMAATRVPRASCAHPGLPRRGPLRRTVMYLMISKHPRKKDRGRTNRFRAKLRAKNRKRLNRVKGRRMSAR